MRHSAHRNSLRRATISPPRRALGVAALVAAALVAAVDGVWFSSHASQSPTTVPHVTKPSPAGPRVAAAVSKSRVERNGEVTYLDDGVIRVGVERGAIVYLSKAGEERNVVDASSVGRLVQASYYAGPRPFGKPEAPWQRTPWNPVAAGDRYGHTSTVLAQRANGGVVYTETVPLQWALDGNPCACTFENWVSLEGNVVHVRNRLVNRRADRRQHPALDQELPAVYVTGDLDRFVTYSGPAPYSHAALTVAARGCERVRALPMTEHWAALVDSSNWGLGVINRDVWSVLGGFICDGGERVGYMAPTAREIIDRNIVYSDAYDLVLGSIRGIRARAAEPRGPSVPNYRFARDRRHWWYIDAADTGWPIRGALHVRLGKTAPQLVGPEQWWAANAVQRIYVQAAFRGTRDVAELYWSAPGEGFSANHWAAFPVVPDGHLRTYEIELGGKRSYRGTITGLRIDPLPKHGANASLELACVSATPC